MARRALAALALLLLAAAGCGSDQDPGLELPGGSAPLRPGATTAPPTSG